MGSSRQTGNRGVIKAAGVVGAATFISRFFGYIRDMVIAFFFGAGMATDAFFVAFRIPNMLRRLVGEGSLTVSFVPIFTDHLQNKSARAAWEFANIVFCLLTAVLAIIVVLGVVFSPLIVKLIAPGFTGSQYQFELTVFLNRLMFPYIFFVSLVALAMGILNVFRHFAAPAVSPIVLNICIIAAAYFLRDFFAEPIVALAIGVFIGGILQLAMQFPFLVKFGFRPRLDFRFNHPGVRRLVWLMLPATLGAAVYQINVFVGTLLASFLSKGSVSYLYYADRIVEMPLGIFGIALGTAILPTLSQQAAAGDLQGMQKSLSFSLGTLLFLTIPAMVALLVLREPIIQVLFGRGAFSATAVQQTADALFCYSLGLWAFASVRIISAGFFALSDTKTPMIAAIVALFVNIVASIALMFPLRHSGLALATTISSTANVAILAVILWRKLGAFLDDAFVFSLSRSIGASLFMVLVLAILFWLYPFGGLDTELAMMLWLLVAVVLGVVAYLSAAFILGSKEIKAVTARIRTKNR